MQNRLVRALRLSALAAAMLAAGCTGGGGGSGDATGSTRTVEGTAAKGIIKGAEVKVYAINTNGDKAAAPLGTTQTGSDGTYSLNIAADILNFVIEVGTAAGATMSDEATGQEIPVPSDFKLRSVMALSSGAETTVAAMVTPFTEMIVSSAENAAPGKKLLVEHVQAARNGITAMLEFDPVTVRPVNSDSADAGQLDEQKAEDRARMKQSLALAAISKAAADSALDCVTGTQAAKVRCVVDAIASKAKLENKTLTLPAAAVLKQKLDLVAADPKINKTKLTSLDIQHSRAFTESSVSTNAATGVEAAKKLFSSIRNNVSALSDGGSIEKALKAPVENLQADFDRAVAPVDNTLADLLEISVHGIDLHRSGATGVTEYFGYGSHCSVPSSGANVVCTTPQRSSHSYINGTYREVVKHSTITFTPVASGQYNYLAETHVATHDGGSITSSTSKKVGENSAGKVEIVSAAEQISQLRVEGNLPPPVNEAGDAAATGRTIGVLVGRINEGRIAKVAFSGEVAASTADITARAVIKPGSFIRVAMNDNGSVAENGGKEFHLLLAAQAGESSVEGGLHLQDPMADKHQQHYLPTKAAFTGTVKARGIELFSGSLTYHRANYASFDTRKDAAAQGNFLQQVVGLSGKLSPPGSPVLSLNLVARNNPAGGRSLFIGYRDGSEVVEISFLEKVRGGEKFVRVSGSQGASFEFSDPQSTVQVMKDGTKLALLNLKKGTVHYEDGSFESLK